MAIGNGRGTEGETMRKRDMNSIHPGTCWLVALMCLPAAMMAMAAEPPSLDTSDWSCEYCVVEKGYSGEVEGGAGWVSDNSFKFGEYNGLESNGAFLVGNATARYRDGKVGYLDLHVRDLGLDTRSIDIKGGQQGQYSLFLDYDGIPHNISDSARTPYLGAGGENLVLPGGWTHAGSTAGMTTLDSSLYGVDLQTLRKRFGIGATFLPSNRWETAINVRHEIRDGQQRTAGSMYFNTAELVAPVDYVTDEVEAMVSYTTRKWQSRLAYYGSFFNDRNTSLTWENAYNPLTPGADTGRLALPPDNRFNQILFTSGYQVSDGTRVSGDVALGKMEQDDALLAATVNPNLSVGLPRQSADAQVDTVTANLRTTSALTDRLRLNASIRYNDRNNKTPSQVFDWVTTDTFAATARRNLPYSFTDKIAKLDADYRVNPRIHLGAGAEYSHKDRTNQEVDSNREESGWGQIRVHLLETLEFSIKGAHSERDASGFHLVPEISPAENPLMRKYNLADRSRDNGSLMLSYTPTERVSIGLSADLIRDRYSKSLLGLTASREGNINADVAFLLSTATTLHAFAAREQIRSEQQGSQSNPVAADWFAENLDTVNTFGFGVKHQLIKDRLDVGADFVTNRSTGEISIISGPISNFPDLKTTLDSVKLYADYRMKKDLSLHAAYWYEHYNSKDWMLDGVDPATLSNVISLGTDSPGYTVNALMLSLRYRY
jgi:MtrB/PioB family decaheme-associated outer membrane protein